MARRRYEVNYYCDKLECDVLEDDCSSLDIALMTAEELNFLGFKGIYIFDTVLNKRLEF